DALDPLGIDDAGAHDAGDLLVEGAHPRRLRPRMVVVVDRRAAPRELLHGGGKPALELVVVVAVEEGVLAGCLVVEDGIDLGEPALERLVPGGALGGGAVGVAAPGDVGAGEIAAGLPAALVDQSLQASAIGARLGAEDAKAGALFRDVGSDAGAR